MGERPSFWKAISAKPGASSVPLDTDSYLYRSSVNEISKVKNILARTFKRILPFLSTLSSPS